jgi:hypothetical protein
MWQQWAMKIESRPALLKDCMQLFDSAFWRAALAVQQVHRRNGPSRLYISAIHDGQTLQGLEVSITDYVAFVQFDRAIEKALLKAEQRNSPLLELAVLRCHDCEPGFDRGKFIRERPKLYPIWIVPNVNPEAHRA